jgi:GNAT superfamily N-acetyltransferase
MIYELIGYLASALVAVSLMMSSILRLRLINLAGATLFSIYGVLIAAWPVATVNLFIVGINIFYLARIYGTKEFFRILEVGPDSEYLRHFVALHGDEMRRHNPDFRFPVEARQLSFFVLRDVVPAGLFVGDPVANGEMVVRLDYVLPGYRDLKVGRFLFRQHAAWFGERGIRCLVARAGTKQHARYLQRMGFTSADGSDPSVYRIELDAAGRHAPHRRPA